MFFQYIFEKLTGKLNISVEGFFIEKFINVCANKKISLNNVIRDNACMLIASTSIKDFKRMRYVCKKTKCKVKILNKVGVPFLLNRYKKRKFILIALIISCIAIIFANTLIWKIEVINSEDEIFNDKIIEEINELGFKKFTYKYGINKEKIINQMIINIKELSWMEIDIKGVVAYIDVRKNIQKPEIVRKEEICNIIASKPGIVEKIIAKSGKTVISKDDVVDKGDLLISGIINSEYIEDRFVHSEGEIYARVWYVKKIKVPYYEENITHTGNQKKYYGINFKNKKLFLGKLSTNYKEYDTILNEINLFVGNYKTKIKIAQCIFVEKQIQKINRNIDEAIEYGLNELNEQIMLELPENSIILDKRKSVINNTDSVEIELIYECMEQIGTKEKIN